MYIKNLFILKHFVKIIIIKQLKKIYLQKKIFELSFLVLVNKKFQT